MVLPTDPNAKVTKDPVGEYSFCVSGGWRGWKTLVGVADGGYTQQTVITYVCLQQDRRIAKAIGHGKGKEPLTLESG